MTKGKDFEMLFSSALREFDDNDIFLGQLERKLEKVECVKRIQEEQKKNYRIKLMLAFVAGALSLLIAVLLLPILPSDLQILQALIDIDLTLPVRAHFLSIILIVVISYGLVFSLNSLRHDIVGRHSP